VSRAACVLVAVLAGLIPAASAAAVPGEWTGGGPPAGIVGLLAVDPVELDTVYGGGFTAFYRSDDGAASWRRLALPPDAFSVNAIAIDPAAHETVYILGAGDLFRSRDRGETWTRLSGVQGVVAFTLLSGTSSLLAGTFESGLQRSDDGGSTWVPSGEGIADPNAVYSLVAAPSDPSVVYAAAGDRLYRSEDGGRTWGPGTAPPGAGFVSALAIDQLDAQTLYVSDFATVYRSTDGGASWSPRDSGLTVGETGFLASLAAAATRPTTLYAVTDRALFRSTDAGGHWSLLNDDFFGTIAPWSIAVDPSDPNRIYRGSGLGVFVSEDGGETFAPASRGLPGVAAQTVVAGPGAVVHAGLVFGGVASSLDGGLTWRPGTGGDVEFESIISLAADPSVAGRVYAGSYTGRFFRSVDDGSTWEALGRRLPRATVWGIAADPGRPGRVVAATEVGVYSSSSGGEQWRRSSGGLPNTGVRTVAFAGLPGRIAYAGLDRGGVFRSSDGGRSWRAAGLRRLTVLSLAVDPRDPDTVYAATRYGGAFRSDDGGRSWKRLAATGLTASIVLDPAAPDTVLLGTDARVVRSDNRGASFRRYTDGLPALGGSWIDPEAQAPLTVVGLAAVPGGAYAATWTGVFGVRFA
jgi:photosystem II stability/assembly factor-like uncharacterized protein